MKSNTSTSSTNTTGRIFQATPSQVIFRDFEPFKKYRETISFRNRDHVQRKIQVTALQSRFFKVEQTKSDKPGGNKVAPGLEIQFDIIFSPEATHDYSVQLCVIVEDEGEFQVPIYAVGDRAQLNFPEIVTFDDAPVKYETTKDFYVQNKGKCATNFVMLAQPPFAVTPREINDLEIDGSFQMSISFHPLDKPVNNRYTSELEIKYDNGEVHKVQLVGTVVDVNVRLSQGEVQLQPTFITEKSQATLKLVNKSEIKVKFDWKLFSTVDEERRHKTRKIAQLSQELDEDSTEYRVSFSNKY